MAKPMPRRKLCPECGAEMDGTSCSECGYDENVSVEEEEEESTEEESW